MPSVPENSTDVALQGVNYRYPRTTTRALHDVSFSAGPGVLGLLGANGAGKTTLLRLIVGSLTPDSGEVVVGDGPARPGYCPQSAAFPARMRVVDILKYCCWLRKVPARQTDGEVSAALRRAALEEQATVRAGALSGGMARRLAITQAFIGGPQVVVLDEPTTGLDPQQRVRCRELVRDVSGNSRAIVMSSHIIEDLWATCERLLILHEGTIVRDILLRDHPEADPWLDARQLEEEFLRSVTRSSR